ncbi:hypothetical protein RFI_24174, partial [Reticulomyxa filosa]
VKLDQCINEYLQQLNQTNLCTYVQSFQKPTMTSQVRRVETEALKTIASLIGASSKLFEVFLQHLRSLYLSDVTKFHTKMAQKNQVSKKLMDKLYGLSYLRTDVSLSLYEHAHESLVASGDDCWPLIQILDKKYNNNSRKWIRSCYDDDVESIRKFIQSKKKQKGNVMDLYMVLSLPYIRCYLCLFYLNIMEDISHKHMLPRNSRNLEIFTQLIQMSCHLCHTRQISISAHANGDNVDANANININININSITNNIQEYYSSIPAVKNSLLFEFACYLMVCLYTDVKIQNAWEDMNLLEQQDIEKEKEREKEQGQQQQQRGESKEDTTQKTSWNLLDALNEDVSVAKRRQHESTFVKKVGVFGNGEKTIIDSILTGHVECIFVLYHYMLKCLSELGMKRYRVCELLHLFQTTFDSDWSVFTWSELCSIKYFVGICEKELKAVPFTSKKQRTDVLHGKLLCLQLLDELQTCTEKEIGDWIYKLVGLFIIFGFLLFFSDFCFMFKKYYNIIKNVMLCNSFKILKNTALMTSVETLFKLLKILPKNFEHETSNIQQLPSILEHLL